MLNCDDRWAIVVFEKTASQHGTIKPTRLSILEGRLVMAHKMSREIRPKSNKFKIQGSYVLYRSSLPCEATGFSCTLLRHFHVLGKVQLVLVSIWCGLFCPPRGAVSRQWSLPPPRANNPEVIAIAVQAVAGRAENSACPETRLFPTIPRISTNITITDGACHHDGSGLVRDP
jgi:hypothetical protein